MSSREPERLPSLRELGQRLNEAAAREVVSSDRRARRRRPWILLGIAGALVVAGGATATGVFTGSGKPVPGEGSRQPGVLTGTAAPDPARGALPWAIRVFTDRDRECVQLGRLRDGRLGTVENGQFRPFEGNAVGTCGDLDREPLVMSFQRRAQPAPRTIAYGLSAGRAPITVTLGGETRRVRPGALGGFVVVFDGIRDVHGATVTTSAGGRPVRLRF